MHPLLRKILDPPLDSNLSVKGLLHVVDISTIVFPQKLPVIYDLDITNPPFNEQIWPVPSDFAKSRFLCTWDTKEVITNIFKFNRL